MGHTWRWCSFVNFMAWNTILTSHDSKLYHFLLSTQFSFINPLILMKIAKGIIQTSFVLFCWCSVSFTSILVLLLNHALTVIPKLIKTKKAFLTADRKGPLIITQYTFTYPIIIQLPKPKYDLIQWVDSCIPTFSAT